MQKTKKMIEVKKLKHVYPTGLVAVKNANLKINKGEKIGIIGQNGAGKTTLVKQFNNLIRPTKGKLLIDGEDIKDKTIAQMAKKIGFIFQNPNDQLFNHNLKEEVKFGLKQIGLNEKEIKKRTKKALQNVWLWEERNMHPSELNYAERKLLSITSILAMDPEIIVFDEPTTGQDHEGTKKIINIIKSLKDKTVIVISHDMDLIANTCEKVVVMSQARIINHDTTVKVFQKKEILKKAFVEPPEIIRICNKLGVEPVLSKKELLKHLKIIKA
jgi:energy-coupling factor transport system ATP-binding protein